ncbi:LPD38 domain-containing protein [Muribaculum intestinale]|uniref:LPD38 domain-containing protein n=1 Tax=Muribaculum intestinale TaxID=1796646 RepID=UPI0025B7614F|nr:LPD38 domain-containing protein [Muribaculum intestinale]
MATDNKRKLYDALSQDYDMGSYEQFCNDLNDEAKRRKLYDATSQEYDLGTWDSFSQQLGYGQAAAPAQERPAAPTAPVDTLSTPTPPPDTPTSARYFKLRRGGKDFTVSTDEVNAAGGLAGWAAANPGAPLRVYMQGKKDDGTDFDGHVDLSVAHDRSKRRGYKYTTTSQAIEDKPWQPTEQEKIAMSHQLHQMQARTDAAFAETRERMENVSEYYRGNRGLGFHTVEGKPVFNPETGKMEKTYLTPTGDRTTSKTDADMATFQFRQAMAAADMSVGAQIRRAEAELAQLRKQYEESKSRVHGEWAEDYEKNDAPLAAVLAANTYVPRQTGDKENSALRVAIRQKEEQLKNLQEERDRQIGKDVGFWRGFGRTVSDVRTWDFGTGDLLDAMTMLNADKYSAPDATEGEKRAGQEMLKAIYDNQQVEEMYGGNASFWNRAGVMTGYMPSFMLDFALTGGGYEAINVAGKAAARGSVKLIGEAAIKEMTELGVKAYAKKYGIRGVGRMAENWTIKALGTTADDLLIRAPLMTNTIQAGKTTADIIDRKLGNVVVDANGNYDFSNDETWGSAIWQGEANAIIENYSEMFGAHLDGVVPALAKTFGGKRISGMLARANASSYGQILSTTRKQFERLGVSDYFGEVSEEYYGQLWRTMLNLDDAYTNVPVYDEQGNQVLDEQGNPVYERKNLLFTEQFHGDIWGGMALSMGLMGAGKYTISGIAYGNMKHQVNVADRTAAEIFTPERWEPIREIIDNTTNDDMGALAESMVNDPNLSDEERAAVMGYMERSLNLRGLNLGAMAQSRGAEDEETVGLPMPVEIDSELSQSYIDGYEASTPQEMNDAQNMYEYQRQRAEGMFEPSMLDLLDTNPVDALMDIARNGLYSQEEIDAARDYVNAKTVRDGILQRVHDNIDEQIAQSDAMIDARVNPASGMIQPAIMGLDDRQVYVVGGTLAINEDGTIDREASDESIVVRDAQTGELQFTDPKSIVSAGEAIDPEMEKAIAVDNIRQQAAQAAADAMNGTLAFNPGDVVEINDGGGLIQVTVLGPLVDEESGMPIEGQVMVQFPNGQQTAFTKEQLQSFADAANLERLNNFEQERVAARTQQQATEAEAMRPQFALNDEFTILNDNGTPIRGSITAELDEDGTVEIHTEEPINGNHVNRFTPAELEELFDTYNGQPLRMPEPFVEPNVETGNNDAEIIPENGNIIDENIPTDAEATEPQHSALSRVPVDEQGQPKYEEADPDTAWDAIVEQTQGDEATAAEVVADIVSEREEDFNAAEKALNKTKEGKPEKRKKNDPAPTMAERIAAKNAAKEALAEAQAIRDRAKAILDHWKKIAGTKQRREAERRSAEDAEARRRAEERAAEEARLRAEREEAERIEREALNGVPDWSVDTPADARARGYRRNGPQKVDRPEIIDNHALGNSVEVKFGDDVMQKGNVVVIDASQLQPSHRDGQRNPAHFLDEAQPKERKDAASRFAATKIAENIRPEEITSSVTAYTGAPSINSRGEVIQGNNRSEALRLMYEGHADSAAKYKQYLIDHAAEFGLTPEAIEAFEQPVLVNMLDVSDENAITLGQYVAQDTESGGIERIKPKNAVQKMGDKIRNFANLLLRSADDEATFAQLVDANGINVLKWMNQQGFITNTQYASAFDSKGNLTAEAANDLKGIMYQSIFTGGSTRLEEMFNKMPAKAQRAILATAFRDYDSVFADRMIAEIQQSIIAFDALMGYEQFRDATSVEATQHAVEAWTKQYAFDDVSGEPYLPSETFSNFALALAAMYKGNTQKHIQSVFNMMYDIVQGTEQDNLFEAADKTPKPLAEAIRRVLNLEYQPITKPTTDNGTNGSAVLDINSEDGQDGRSGSDGNADGTEQHQEEAEPADGGTGTASDSGQGSDVAAESNSVNIANALFDESGNIIDVVGLTELGLSAEQQRKLKAIAAKRTKGWEFDATGRTSTIKIGGLFGFELTQDEMRELARLNAKYNAGMITRRELSNAHTALGNRVASRISDEILNSTHKTKQHDFDDLDYSALAARIEVSEDDWVDEEGDTKYPTHKRTIIIDGKYNVTQVDEPDAKGDYTGSYFMYEGERFGDINEIVKHIDKQKALAENIATAEAEVNTDPTPGQKEAGNYKKGHVQVGTFDVTIEQPVGSVRRGTDADGKEWETTMQNTYGYIRGTEGVDGDHIDVFLSDNIDGWNGRRVVIVDQYNPDGTFDEHKVMLGFNDKADAINAYLANYEKGWEKGRRLVFSTATLDDFEKWIESSHRKQKPYHEYKIAEKAEVEESNPENPISETEQERDPLFDEVRQWLGMKGLAADDSSRNAVMRYFKIGYVRAGNILNAIAEANAQQSNSTQEAEHTEPTGDYTIDTYTTKKGKTYHRVVFPRADKAVWQERLNLAKKMGGTSVPKGYGFKAKEEAEAFAKAVADPSAVADAQPLSLDDIRPTSGVAQVDVEGLMSQLSETGEANLADHSTPVEATPDNKGEEKPEEKPVNPSGNRLVTDERYAELRERMRKKLGGQLNMGVDPEILAIGTEMAVYHIEKGARKFKAYASAMIADLGDAIRPYLKSFYNAVRDMPEAEAAGLVSDMDSYDEVRSVDIANFDKPGTDAMATAAAVVAEQEAETEKAEAERKLQAYRHLVNKYAQDIAESPMFKKAVSLMDSENVQAVGSDLFNYYVGEDIVSIATDEVNKMFVDQWNIGNGILQSAIIAEAIRKAHKAIRDEQTTVNPDGTTTQTVVESGTQIEITSGDFIPGVRPSVETEKKPGGKKKPGKTKPKPTTDGGLFDAAEDDAATAPAISVPEQRPAADLIGDSAAYQEREAQTVDLVEEIGSTIENRVSMLELDPESVKPLTMTDVKKMASKYPALKDISDTDLQELVELAMTQLTRSEALVNIDGTAEAQRAAFDHIVKLYQIQPSLNARDSERLIKQQYSTPTPFGFVMGQFVRAGGKAVGSMLEPSAGNGALTITVHPSAIHVNDIDDARLANLRKLGFGQVTAQDALLPFSGDKVDVVMTNPPFGTVTEKVYDGVFRISSLEGQMAINALEQMKDDGRAAIVIGGNTSYRTNGSMNPKDAAFFGYLYSHYNVADVINISGKALYSRNGTGYDVRMILIDGRKTGEFQRVYPPVKAKARAEQITTFDELYKRVQDDIQQIQQVGNQSANVQRDPETAADGTASASVRSGNNRPNTGAGQRPGTTGDAVRDTPRTDSGQPTPGNVGSRPAGVDNADTGNAGSTDNVPQSKPEQPRSVGGGSTQNGTGRSGSNGRGTVATRPDSGAERLEVKPDLTTEKVPYPNQSGNGFTLMSVVPAAQAQVLQKSLGEIGDVDQYLVDELGYSSKEELYGYLAAEQIDSVALAIHQMNKGNAFIIGDMTGVGKGRQGAALIRYAVKQGKVPIYFTQKPTLYTDNYRDLCDIGSSDLRPFIIASNPKDANIVDADGNVVHKLPSKKEQERVFNYIMEHGTLPDEYDYVLTTYDQIKNGTADYSQNEDGTWNTEARKLPKKSKGYTTADYNGQARRDALAKLAEGNITILDESHTVGGDSGCGRYMQMLTSQAGGVTFLSATFAKRADNMPIYAQRTAIAEAGVKASELIDAIMKGGVTLQEIMSKQLVESGQMIRRERSFDGVTIDWLSVSEETDRRQRQQFNEVADIFNAIRNFQDDYITPIIDAKNEAAAEFGATVGHTQGTKDMGVKNVPFASKMYNLVNQLLFALKVDAVADRVVENLRNGYKPVISFTNTMEGFLSSAPKGVAMDDVPKFSLTLMRALDGVMRFTEKDADENSEGGSISLSELSTEGQNAYNAIREKIMSLSADLPISPMDAIRMKIEEAGYSVAEITGRTMQLNRTEDGRYIVEARKDRDKKAAMRDFNSGKLDVLMINKSGSTGISLHASSKFEDQRPRVMVFAQFQSDINDEVQMRGRIDRSGQVTRGRYEYIMSTIPAEQRIQMMFKAKLKSLDANTTSSQKSKFNEMEIVDYLNKYGDEVVWEYMKEHPELEERLGDPLDMLQEKNDDDAPRTSEKEDTSKKTGCAGKISRYLAFLSVEEQDEIFREITEAYRVKIQLLDDAGENDLEITTMPLRAETKRKQIWHEGENPGSGNAFADNTYVEEVEVDVLKKPMKRAEIEEATRKLVGDKGLATEYDQQRYGFKEGEVNWNRYAETMQREIDQFFQTKADEAVAKLKEAGDARVAKTREKAVAAATKARSRGENNFSDEEIQSLADTVANEAREKETYKQRKRREEIMAVRDRIKSLFTNLRAGSIYVVPQDLKQATPEMFSQTFGTFVGFKFNKSFTLGSSTAIFATLDGRRKVELALSDPAINTIINATEITYRYSPKDIRAISMENWDSKVPTQTRQKRYIITGNLLQALVDTEKGEKTRGNLISYSTIDGETRQGILMGENFKLTDLRNSAPLSSRLAQIREGKAVVSENGDVQIEREMYDWRHRGEYKLSVPKSKQRGGIYTMNPDLLKLVDGHNFITKGNSMIAYVAEADIAKVVDMLSRAPFNLTVVEESKLTDVSADEAEDDVLCRPVTDKATLDRLNSEPTIKVYRAMQMIDGGLRPPMSAKVDGELREATEVGVWEEAEEHPEMADENGRFKLDKGNGKSIKAAYNPYIHTSRSPINDQFSSAWSRPELVTVEVEIPASELTSEYHAEKAKDSVGEKEWKSGPVGRVLAKIGQARKVILSRWSRVVRVVPVEEVADAYAQRLNAHGIEVPFNTVPPALRDALAERGVKIGKPEKGNAGAASMPAFEQWIAEQERQRMGDGYGAYSDAEVSMANDPISKVMGKNRFSKKRQAEFAARERQRMANRIQELAERMHLDNVEIITDASQLEGKRAKAKGFYNKRTGKITIVIPNNVSTIDAEQTLLHEAVAHYGLRQLFGEQFNTFLDNVYQSADESIRRKIAEMAAKNGWDFRTATEEYLAGLAEDTNFGEAQSYTGWWSKIKRLFLDMLDKIGFEGFRDKVGVVLTDNELRYILWRSYENLAEPGRYRSILGEAADVAKQSELKVGNYAEQGIEAEYAAEGDLYRPGDFSPRDRVFARYAYESMVRSGSYQFKEAVQDSMLGLKALYQAILGKKTRLEDVAGFENAYLFENRMSSMNAGEQHEYFQRYMQPLLKEIARIAGASKTKRRELTDYIMAKHGLERNEYMRNEAAANGEDTERDFAGLIGLTGEADWQSAEDTARQWVDDYESMNDTTALWEAINKATKATLEKVYLSGIISKETYEKILGMYDYYVPLRGWNETTSDEVYGYLTSKDGPLGGSIMKKAEGRESMADDPIATIGMMADDAIRQGNRNLMKQRFLNFILNHPSDAVSVHDLWLEYNDVTDEWVPVFADVEETDTAEVVEQKVKDFEERMEALRTAEPDKYKRGRETQHIPYKVVRGNLREHQILIKRNGRTFVATINGNPRAAQAINGLTNPDVDQNGVVGNMLKAGTWVNRQLSAFYTTRNPDFVAGNFFRDMLYSNCMTWVKESPRYARRFHKNFARVNPIVMRRLLGKWENGTLDMGNRLESLFYQFMKNGGETGYTNVRDIEGHKRAVAAELKKQGSTGRRVWTALGMQLDLLNRSAENCARFAAFVTSRDFGRSIDRSIYDAKEISVNFNKKGSGGKMVNAKGQTKLGKAGAYLGGGGRLLYVFWNAGIQGMTNFGRQAKLHPAKFSVGATALFTLGYVIPMLAQMLGGGDGDDDDKNAYYNLPEYVRRSNICFYAGEQWITIPLPIEYRAMYGMGELAHGVISGNERYSNSELARQMASQVSQIMPIDMLEGGGGISPFIPSAAKPFTEAYIMNKGWTGLPVYKDTPFNKNDPEWTKAYASADKPLVAFAKWLNETSGGDDFKKGAIDINPAKIEYLLNGTFGGVFTFPNKIKKSGETMFGDREFEWRNMPIANRLIKSGDERTANRKLQNEYFKYLKEYEATGQLMRKYENADEDGIMGYAERINFLENSPEYARWEIFDEFKADIDAYREDIAAETDKEERARIEAEMYAVMRELVNALHDPEAYRNREQE